MPKVSDYSAVRRNSIALCRHLEPEDYVVQSMPDVSPTKWHLAHTTWFLEHFVLEPFLEGYQLFDEDYHYLFNSYYFSAGRMHLRPRRGLLSRPLVREVLQYRDHVDEAVQRLLELRSGESEINERLELGLNHEQQHQELLLTDIKHVFSCNPALPPVNPELNIPENRLSTELRFNEQSGGVFEIGAYGESFCFDNEKPRHPLMVPDHALGSRLVSNAEFRQFIEDKGYEKSTLWLSDGWSSVNHQGWNRPLYWSEDLSSEFTLGGLRDLDLNAPVAHVSYYEADAFARWAGYRLPTEAEWELAAATESPEGNLLDSGYWQPIAADGSGTQLFGDVWEWTSSPYSPYPGFKPLADSLGEYNGKFMCNQVTVRGGSCVTANEHIRASYRSFFYPDARWQFLGFRLANDCGPGR
jgi:ergothioneine biosynthesis protein EgtB